MTWVVVVGDIVTDIVAVHSGPIVVGSDTPATVSLTGGGSAANTAAWLAHVGVPVELVGVVGVDAAGTGRRAELTRGAVGVGAVRRVEPEPTGSIIVLVRDGERSFLTDRGANRRLEPSDVDQALTASADHLHLSGYTLFDPASRPAGVHALAAARARGLSTSVDAASAAPLAQIGPAAFRGWVHGVDLIFANDDEATVLGPELSTVVGHVVVKRGASGATWTGPHGTLTVPATPAVVVDPTGAGDAFAAGFLAAWLTGAAPADVLRSAVDLGARAVTVIGGRPPDRPTAPH